MASSHQHLKLRIERDGKVLHRNLRGDDSLTVGRHPNVDVMLYGENHPRAHTLISSEGGRYTLHLPPNARGEILYQDSRLSMQDLIVHGLLPQQHKGFFSLPITAGKAGYVIIDGVRIDFVFDGTALEAIDFRGFSPLRAFAKSLLEDPLFKFIVVGLFLFHATLAYVWGQREVVPRQAMTIEKIPERFAKFVVAAPKPAAKPDTRSAATDAAGESANDEKEAAKEDKENDAASSGSAGGGRDANPAELGVLGLIGGTGTRGQQSNVMDFLISKDLAAGLERVTDANRTLSVGRGKNPSAAPDPTALLASSGNRGIDDLVQGDLGSVESIKLTKSGRVNVGNLRASGGSQAAVGARSEESLRDVLTANMGRLQYIYNKYLKTNPEMSGKLEVEVTINAEGTVKNVTIVDSDFSNPDFTREIFSALRRWRYEPIASGEMKVVYPILFVRTN
jgi:TonB family protein